MINQAAIDEVLSRLLPLIRAHLETSPAAPFILALSGLQGSGKSTWAAALCRALSLTHATPAATVSLDDFYHTHEKLVEIRDANPGNALLRTRGQPGTHDEELAARFFATLASGRAAEVRVPRFDKSLFNGQGDRLPPEEWPVVPAQPRLQVVVFEGWCLGFRPLDEASIRARHAAAAAAAAAATRPPGPEACPTSTLAQHPVGNLLAINENLKRYVAAFMGPQHLDAMVHLSTDSLANVYAWRVGQERALVEAQGMGMDDGEVVRFVRGYMPAYELYLPALSDECFFSSRGEQDERTRQKAHLKIMLDVQRNVQRIEEVCASGKGEENKSRPTQ